MAGFSEVFSRAQARIEALAEIHELLNSVQTVLEKVEKRGLLSVEDAASLIAAGRDASCRAEIEAAAKRDRL